MSLKVIIANNNDILYNSLSNVALQYESKIEIINVPTDKLPAFICRMKHKKNLIVLDSISSVSFYTNILKNALEQIDKRNIIILVIDSENLTNTIINQEKHNWFFKKRNDFSFLEAINIVSDTLKDTLEIEKNIDTILWRLGFTSYFKGTIYLKEAILLAYYNNNLLYDMNLLVDEVAKKYNISNPKVVRSDMDKSLNNTLDFTDNSNVYSIFGDDYDGRKISLKYLIDLCIRYLEKQRYCCLDY